MRKLEYSTGNVGAASGNLCPECNSRIYLVVSYPKGMDSETRVRTLRCTSAVCSWEYARPESNLHWRGILV